MIVGANAALAPLRVSYLASGSFATYNEISLALAFAIAIDSTAATFN